MKRVTIFAHYSSENVIEDYVVFYIKNLLTISDDIIFVSDSDLQEEELCKISQYVKYSITKKHGEYDFGSYKRGYEYLYEHNLLQNYDELIFANDSCYAPLFSFETMFEVMSSKDIDFWGNTQNQKKEYGSIKHIQTYFVVFKQKVFLSDCFKNFILSVKKQNAKENVVATYECGLTKILSDAGFTWDVYCEFSKNHKDSHLLYYQELVIKDKSPFLKRKIPILYTKTLNYLLKNKSFINNYTNYNYELIKQCSRYNFAEEIFYTIWKLYRYWSERLLNKYL